MKSRRLVFLGLGVLTILRFILLPLMELTPDEAYYFQWSQHLDLSYYSKGPGVALTMWLGTHLFGPGVFGIRFFSPLLALGTCLLLYRFAFRLYGESVALWAVLLVNFIPIFQAGGVLMTIDPLSIFFWMAALFSFWLALEKGPDFNRWWPITGALIGAGFVAKYTNAMQLISILAVLLITAKHRRELRRPGFYLLLGVFLLFTIPILVWNAQHGWITVAHLLARGGLEEGKSWHPTEFFTYFGLHLAVYSPLIFCGLIAALVLAWPKARAHFKPRFLLAFSLPLLVLYFGLSLKKSGEPNWTAPAMLSLVILAAALWLELCRERRWARFYAGCAFCVGGLLSVAVLDTDLVRQLGLPFSYDLDPSARLRGWETVAARIQAIRDQFESAHGQPTFLIANKYGTAASLGFYLPHPRLEGPGHPPVYCPESAYPENQYFFWPGYDGLVDFTEVAVRFLREGDPRMDAARRVDLEKTLAALPAPGSQGDPERDAERRRRFLQALKAIAPELGIDDYYTESMGYSPFVGRTALYITDRGEDRPASTIERTFKRCEMIACLDEERRGLPLRQIRIFACYDYHELEL